MTPELEQLYQEIIGCQKCILSQSRRNAVPGEGSEEAEIVFIGEAPGFHEDQQGRPFVGSAGARSRGSSTTPSITPRRPCTNLAGGQW